VHQPPTGGLGKAGGVVVIGQALFEPDKGSKAGKDSGAGHKLIEILLGQV
jgi:hypothetical protein